MSYTEDRTRATLNRRQLMQGAGAASFAMFAQRVMAGGQIATPDVAI